jgi:hypothetical protein
MRLLVAIPHYYRAGGPRPGYDRDHGSTRLDPAPRIAALSACIGALHRAFGAPHGIILHSEGVTAPANDEIAGQVDVVVCTAGDDHLLNSLPAGCGTFHHRRTAADPLLLGFECRAALRDGLGGYDYYGYMEDDLILHDPWFFRKLAWFNAYLGDEVLLLPNRYEAAPEGLLRRVYVDGDLPRFVVEPFQDLDDRPRLASALMGARVEFCRPLNPHAGCHFLDARQMARLAARPDFLEPDTRFIGPLESAATLGILRAFRVYKPAPANASFLEIEHYGNEYLNMIKNRDEADPAHAG